MSEQQKKPIKKFAHRAALWVIYACIGLSVGIRLYFLKQNPPAHWNEPDFEDEVINSRIMTIEYYNKGFPRVILRDKRSVLLYVAGVEGKKYVSVGDSLVKRAGTNTVTVYRKYPTYTEVSVFGEGEDLEYEYSGILQRYRITVSPPHGR